MRDPSFGAIAILRDQQAEMNVPRCGFCGHTESEAGLLIRGSASGGRNVFICAPCVHQCADRLPRPKSMGRAPK